MDLKGPLKKESVKPLPDVQKNISAEQQPLAPETQDVVESAEPTVEVPSVSKPTTTEEQPAVPEFSVNPPLLQAVPTGRQGGGKGVVSSHVDKLESEIEDVLEEDLTDLYLGMPSEKQIAFRKKGEETRSLIRQLTHHAHKNAKKIFELIREWLKLVPGVNRFFLEQEAKIKTDKILMVTDEEQRRESKEVL